MTNQARVLLHLLRQLLAHRDRYCAATGRAYAARAALEALQMGYVKGFNTGLENDARLFGAVTSSHSGQYWVERFLNKDPLQSALLTLLTPA